MLDIIGKRFFCFVMSLLGGFAGLHYLADPIAQSKYLDFITVLSSVYIGGQTVSDTAGFISGTIQKLKG